MKTRRRKSDADAHGRAQSRPTMRCEDDPRLPKEGKDETSIERTETIAAEWRSGREKTTRIGWGCDAARLAGRVENGFEVPALRCAIIGIDSQFDQVRSELGIGRKDRVQALGRRCRGCRNRQRCRSDGSLFAGLPVTRLRRRNWGFGTVGRVLREDVNVVPAHGRRPVLRGAEPRHRQNADAEWPEREGRDSHKYPVIHHLIRAYTRCNRILKTENGKDRNFRHLTGPALGRPPRLCATSEPAWVCPCRRKGRRVPTAPSRPTASPSLLG